jgi:arabinan endo-1,5-alpha-L-arabinosidase
MTRSRCALAAVKATAPGAVILCLALALGSVSCASVADTGPSASTITFPARPIPFAVMDSNTQRDSATWGFLNAHDPSIYFDEASGFYYVYSTDLQKGMLTQPGCQIRRSRDLVDWEFVGWAMPDGVPADVGSWVSPRSLWAPDCASVSGEYRLYYSASHFGKQRSAIALAVSSRPEGPFASRGIVLKTDEGDPVNAIDPTVVTDAATGEQYLSYGSFWGGIRLLALDRATGLPAKGSAGYGLSIACRPRSVDGAIEGSYIIHNPANGYYYLFVSYGSLFADYNVRVARSKAITGPYLDRNGAAMTDMSAEPNAVGFKILAGYRFGESRGWASPGHNSVLRRGDDWFIVHHMRPADDTSWAYLCVRKIFWTADGWPLASPFPYAGETEQAISPTDVTGVWDLITFENESPAGNVSESFELTLRPDGTFTRKLSGGKTVRGDWSLDGKNGVTLRGKAGAVADMTLFAFPAWDRDEDVPVMAMTGVDVSGRSAWARKAVMPR